MGFFRHIFSSKVLPSWTILLIDAIIVVVSVVVAFFLRFSFSDIAQMSITVWSTIGLTLFVNIVFFRLFHTYSNVLRQIGRAHV